MKYEIYKSKNKWFLRIGDNPNCNQQTAIFNLLMKGKKMDRFDALELTGSIKLPSRISEINEALARIDDGLKVSYKRVNTKHGGYYFVYFLTKSQRTQIKDAVLGVTA